MSTGQVTKGNPEQLVCQEAYDLFIDTFEADADAKTEYIVEVLGSDRARPERSCLFAKCPRAPSFGVRSASLALPRLTLTRAPLQRQVSGSASRLQQHMAMLLAHPAHRDEQDDFIEKLDSAA